MLLCLTAISRALLIGLPLVSLMGIALEVTLHAVWKWNDNL